MGKPRIVISKCFSYPVRYNGGIVYDDFVEKLKGFVEYNLVCPEMEIGLGVPRQKIIIIKESNRKLLFQPETGRNLTEDIRKFTDDFVEKVKDIDGFILKSKSPSCGINSANYYQNKKIIGRTDGFFAEGIKDNFPELAVEHEGRLKNSELREHFLIRIFSFAEFRKLKEEYNANDLVKFHTRYKYLLMTYNQKNLREMGKVVADGKVNIKEKLEIYEKLFYNTFVKKPSRTKHFNTILHIYGYFSNNLNQKERKHFLNLLEKYKNGNVELRVIIEMIRNFAYRLEDSYLLNQKYLTPFPENLVI
ncbi:MAG: YbgA family protein [bacterium]